LQLSDNAREIAEKRYFHENEDWEKLSRRVGKYISLQEKESTKWENIFAEEIFNMLFIPGGRILRNSGLPKQSMLNCVCLSINDSIEAIGDTIKNALIMWSYGAGIGIDFSPLREKGRPLKSKGGHSSGMMSFITAIDAVARTIETGGQRRSGLLAMVKVDHPEIFEFIDAKKIDKKLPYVNLSVAVDENFLHAVENDMDWNLQFSGQVVRTVKAREIWDKILESMLNYGDPGIINTHNLYRNNTFYFQRISSTNLCGEIPLPASGACCLGSIVLPNFLYPNSKNTNWKKLETSIRHGVRFLDNVLDVNFYPIKEVELTAKDSRRLGLGVMGLHDYLMMKEIRYGSEVSLLEVERLFRFIRNIAYQESIKIADEKGTFPKFSKNEYCNASFIRKLPPKIRIDIKKFGIRNSCIIAAPPTGTSSLLCDVSSGIEPVFSLSYMRKDRVSERLYVHPKLKELILSGQSEKPDWLIDTYDLTPTDHLEIQTTIQKYLDNAISKTVNCPKDMNKNDLNDLLLEFLYDVKGITIYRDGSKEDQVLNNVSFDKIKKYVLDDKSTQNMSTEDTKCSTGSCEY